MTTFKASLVLRKGNGDEAVPISYDTKKISIWYDDDVHSGTNLERFATFVNTHCEGQRVVIAVTNPLVIPDVFDVVNNDEDALFIKDFLKKITVDCDIYVNANFTGSADYWNTEYDNWTFSSGPKAGQKILDVNYFDTFAGSTFLEALKPAYLNDTQTNKNKMGAVIFWINYCNYIMRGLGNSTKIKGLMFEGENSIYNNDGSTLDMIDAFMELEPETITQQVTLVTSDNISVKGMTGDFTKGSDPMLSRVQLFMSQYYDFYGFGEDSGGDKYFYTDALTSGGLHKQLVKSDTIPKNEILNSTCDEDGACGSTGSSNVLSDGVILWDPAPRIWMTSPTGSATCVACLAENIDMASTDGDGVLETRSGSIYKNVFADSDVKNLTDMKNELWEKFAVKNNATGQYVYFKNIVAGPMNVSSDAYCPLLKVDCTPTMCKECDGVSVNPNVSVSFGIFSVEAGIGGGMTGLSFKQFLNYMEDFRQRMNSDVMSGTGFDIKHIGIYNYRYMPEIWGGPTDEPPV